MENVGIYGEVMFMFQMEAGGKLMSPKRSVIAYILYLNWTANH